VNGQKPERRKPEKEESPKRRKARKGEKPEKEECPNV
jgi:hypothetical protein